MAEAMAQDALDGERAQRTPRRLQLGMAPALCAALAAGALSLVALLDSDIHRPAETLGPLGGQAFLDGKPKVDFAARIGS